MYAVVDSSVVQSWAHRWAYGSDVDGTASQKWYNIGTIRVVVFSCEGTVDVINSTSTHGVIDIELDKYTAQLTITVT